MKYIIIAAAVILVAFLAVLSQIPIGIEPLTELYFENHTKLPKSVLLNSTYNFTFTVHNIEYQDMGYGYRVWIENETGNFIREVDSGYILLSNNESRSINELFSIENEFGRARVNVEINKTWIGEPEFKRKLWWEDPNRADKIDIHFWIDEAAGQNS